jgi:neutral ceramidase
MRSESCQNLFNLALVAVAVIQAANADASVYKVGAGIADVTGPAAGINMMGYANPSQITAGIHTRQYSRTFIVDDGTNRIVYANVDCGMIDQLVKTEVVNRLKAKYGSVYSVKNVLISGTHTHSGPGGFLQYLLFTITTLGWVEQSFEALVSGIVTSIDRAQDNMKDAHIYYTKDILLDANINRSPASYLNNPPAERAKFAYNTDKDFTQLKFVSTNGEPLGVLNWFAVHLTSMNNTNPFISADNKGYAALRFEAELNPESLPGKGPFVAAFGQSNLGDVSPNTNGPHCMDTGLPCDFETSTCNNRTQLCIATGPGKDMFDSTRIIGLKQFEKAHELFDQDIDSMEALEGPVQFVHQFVDMPEYTLEVQDSTGNKQNVKLCKPAMGYSFAAGTTDGPGAFDFTQGTTSGNPFWNMVSSILAKPSEEQISCHQPKPILLDTGDITWPYLWHPHIVETQLFRIGQLIIAAVPGEFTTMAGRRLREQMVQEARNNGGGSNVKAVIAGLSNVYTHYITTFEEYQIQRYEGASTIYGPHSLSAYIDQYKKMTRSMLQNVVLEDGPEPPNLHDNQLSLVPGVVFDSAPDGKAFGDCVVQPKSVVKPEETVTATFVAGHPRNNLMTEETFLTVEKKEADGRWKVVSTDGSFDTIFYWQKTSGGMSEAEVRWMVPSTASDGEYRFSHFGYHKNIDGGVLPYNGTSQTFQVKGQ